MTDVAIICADPDEKGDSCVFPPRLQRKVLVCRGQAGHDKDLVGEAMFVVML